MTLVMASIAANVKRICHEIRASCAKKNRDPAEIRIVAVAKGFGPEEIRQAVEAGISDVGENFLQESLPKQEALAGLPITWHFTGHVQRNKAKSVISRFHLVHSVDSVRLARALDEAGRSVGRKIPVLLQLQCHPRATHGFLPEELEPSFPDLLKFEGLEICGLMTMAPPVDQAEEARPFFKLTREIFAALQKKGRSMRHLSMGMTGDFQVAVEEGATLVRIGRGIFGKRG